MTVVAGITDGEKTWLGADKMCSNGVTRPFSCYKLFQREDWALAIAGEAWILDVLEHVPREIWESDHVFNLANAIKKACLDAGWEKSDTKGEPSAFAVGGLIARPGKLWTYFSDFYPHKIGVMTVEASGCGHDIARGVGYALSDRSPLLRVTKSIEVTNALHPRCGLGMDLIVLK